MTHVNRACIIACRLALALAAGASCRQVVNFEPKHTSRDAGTLLREPDAGTDAGTLFDPKPYLSGPECTRCIEESCGDQSAACGADAYCSRWLEGRRALDRPIIASPDFYGELLDDWWAALHGETGPNTAPSDEFHGCVEHNCRSACAFGRDFSCVDRFAWPQTFPERIELRFRISDAFQRDLRLDGWQIRACARQVLCKQPLGDAMTQDGGFATLAVDLSPLTPGVMLPEFEGFLLLDGAPEYPRIQFDQSSPFFDREFYPFEVFTSEAGLAIAKDLGLPHDENRGLLQITPWDCSQRVATGVTVEVWNADNESGFHPCEDCRPVYPGDNALPDRTLEDFSASSFGPASAYADPGAVMVVMRDTKTRLPLGFLRPVTIRKGYVHLIALYPAPAGKLQDLSEDAR